MTDHARVPVIFIAFANDPERPLDTLDRERKGILRALEPLTASKRWEVRAEPNASLDDIVHLFQSAEFRNRIAIFHYAGHARADALSLTSDAGRNIPALAGGFAKFLAEQRGLKLVVLNGCQTKAQATGLLDAGVSHVVATSAKIDDTMATEFAKTLYGGLVGGAPLGRAFKEASAVLQTRGHHPERSEESAVSTHRGAEVDDDADAPPPQSWWDLYPAAADAVSLTLDEVEGDPFFGLPPLAANEPLPPDPYVEYLARFERRHAAIFFGRGEETRKLYAALTDPNAAPILLLYGQSGVGKSSLLDAGLLPRLGSGADAHAVLYSRRSAETGCLGTVLATLAEGEASLIAAWTARERSSGKPVTIILDQVEEAFTAPRDHGGAAELRELVTAVAEMARSTGRPSGKLVLSFRKEWLAEVTGRLNEAGLAYSPMFLEPLGRKGIVEAIEGPMRDRRLGSYYRLEIDDGLAAIIADDLRVDRGSPIAPVLQILLWRLWNGVKTNAKRQFTRDTYEELQKQGVLLDDFLDGQLAAIAKWKPDLVQSGFILDYLREHTTDLGTADECTEQELADLYPHRAAELPAIREAMVSEYHLLVETPSEREENTRTTRLAHDTLAPLVRKRFDASVAQGQKARRLLENRRADWEGARATREIKALAPSDAVASGDASAAAVLDEVDLAQVERGRSGMRGWTLSERRLVDASRVERDARQRRQRQLRMAGAVAVVMILAFGIGMAWQWRQATRSGKLALAGQLMAEGRASLAQSWSDALLLGAAAIQQDSASAEIRRDLRALLQRTADVQRVMPSRVEGMAGLTAFSHDGARIAQSLGDAVIVFDTAGGVRDSIPMVGASNVAFSPDGRRVAVLQSIVADSGKRERIERAIVAYEIQGQSGNSSGPRAADTLFTITGHKVHPFSDDGRFFTVEGGGRISVHDVWSPAPSPGKRGTSREATDLVAPIVYNSVATDGRHLAVVDTCSRQAGCYASELWDLRETRSKPVFGVQYASLFSPPPALGAGGRFVATHRPLIGFEIRDVAKDTILTRIRTAIQPITYVVTPDGKALAALTLDSVYLWTFMADGRPIRATGASLPPNPQFSLRLDGNGKRLVVASGNSLSASRWNLHFMPIDRGNIEPELADNFGGSACARNGIHLPRSISISGNALVAAYLGPDDCIAVRDFQTGAFRADLNVERQFRVERTVLSADGSKLLAALPNNGHAVWDLAKPSGSAPRVEPADIHPDTERGSYVPILISDDGRTVAFSDQDALLYVKGPDKRLVPFPGDALTGAAFKGDTLFVSTESELLAWTPAANRVDTVSQVSSASDVTWALRLATPRSFVVTIGDGSNDIAGVSMIRRDGKSEVAFPARMMDLVNMSEDVNVALTPSEDRLVAVSKDLYKRVDMILSSRTLRDQACAVVGWELARPSWTQLRPNAPFPCQR